jgi:hypothetical protein
MDEQTNVSKGTPIHVRAKMPQQLVAPNTGPVNII